MSKKRVVIIGGGFGGVKAALTLADSTKYDVTVVSDHPDFRYYPSLYRTATGGRRILSSMLLSELFENKNVKLVRDKMTSLDRSKKTIFTSTQKSIGFDTLIIAMGVQTNYFGIEGLAEYSFGIKTLQEAERLKRHLHDQLIADEEPDLNYVVIGGGPTGVELAGSLLQYLRELTKKHQLQHRKVHIDLIEATSRILPRMPLDVSRSITRRLRHLGVKIFVKTVVQAQTADMLLVKGKKIKSHTVIWTAGVTNHLFFKENDFQLGHSGKVRVNQFLQAEPDIYVIGDNADTPYSGMAQTALHDGNYVANSLIRLSDNKDPKPYRAKKPIYVIPVGKSWAAVLWGQIRIYGRLGAVLRSLADLIGYHDYEPWYSAGTRWLSEDDNEDLCPVCGMN